MKSEAEDPVSRTETERSEVSGAGQPASLVLPLRHLGMSLNLNDNAAVERFLGGILLMEGNTTAEACGQAIEKLRRDGCQTIEDVISFVDGTQRQAYKEEFAASHA